ncbi:MAG: pantoate kinase [Candidatus Bathyarchaeia archaeon]
MTKRATAFSPAGISSFFEICDRTPNGKLLNDPEKIGARGGGFGISKGVLTEVSLAEAKEEQIRVFINGKLWPEAETTRTVVEPLLEKIPETYHVTVRHRVEVPIGAGFGSSAAGALGTALALSKALDLNLTYNQLGRIAHVAEVKCLTGLGTVGPLMLGGCIVTTEPGAPGYASIDRIPVSPNHRIVAGTYRPFLTKEMLSSQEKRSTINEWGQRTLEKILADPSLENFMRACKEFAIGTGLITSRVRKLIELAEKAGAIGAAQNMVGEAVHALVTADKVEDVVQAFKKVMPSEKIIIAKIDLQGARRLR